MPDDARKKLAAAQLELAAALVGKRGAPAGFDAKRIQAAANALTLKRARSVARAWPQLARSLGSDFDDRFALYAQTRPLAQESEPLADGRAFARAVSCALADEARIETL